MAAFVETRGAGRTRAAAAMFGWFGRIVDFLRALAAARRAASVYEAYDQLPDDELARRGLRRQDIAGLAARELEIR